MSAVSGSGGLRGGFGAEAGDDEADFFVGDFGWEGFLEGLEAVHAELAASGGDLVVAFGRQPARVGTRLRLVR